MKVLFAPDYSEANPYQALLANALREEGVQVSYLRGYRRVMPLARSLRSLQFDLFHLHWPEAYFPQRGDLFDSLRIARFPRDLLAGLRGRPLVATAHNRYPHAIAPGRAHSAFRRLYEIATLIIAHSAAAADLIGSTFGVSLQKFEVIPHGDLAEELRIVPAHEEAIQRPGLPKDPFVLIFGGLQPYKGIEEIMEWWRPEDLDLYIVGACGSPAYEAKLKDLAKNRTNIKLQIERLSAEDLACWISASRAVAFNHLAGLTSGAASLARSLDAPLLLPRRLDTVDLDEPHARVFRFEGESEFRTCLVEAISSQRVPVQSAAWRQRTSWKAVSGLTAAAYRRVLSAWKPNVS